MTAARGSGLGSDFGASGPSNTLGVAVRGPEQIRRAQVVAADMVFDPEATEEENRFAVKQTLEMLGIRELTGLERLSD